MLISLSIQSCLKTAICGCADDKNNTKKSYSLKNFPLEVEEIDKEKRAPVKKRFIAIKNWFLKKTMLNKEETCVKSGISYWTYRAMKERKNEVFQ